LQCIEKDDLKGINTVLKSLLAEQVQFVLTETDKFRGWFEKQSIEKLGESITVRCLTLIRRFPELCGFDYLYNNFLKLCGKANLYLNSHNTVTEHIFAELIETTAIYMSFPSNEEDFTKKIKTLENSVKEKIKFFMNEKLTLPEKDAEYFRLFFENDSINNENSIQLLFEILFTEKELSQFLFANIDIPLCYLIYFIALDEYGHFTPIVRQASINSLRYAKEDYLWKKFLELRSDYFKIHPFYAPIIMDVTVYELSHSICKALRFLEAEYEYKTILEISNAIFETMPNYRKFLYNFSLTISNANADAVLSNQWASLAFRTFHDISDKSNTVKRFIEILDYSLPNSRGIPAVLFKYKELVLPFIRREYLRYKYVDNEAEIRLRSVIDQYYPPKEENKLYAKIMHCYIEPIQSIFNISEANEETLFRINEYIESIYGKQLSMEAAKEKALELIAYENKNIKSMNRELDGDTENLWQLLEEGSYQWDKLYSILIRQYTQRNTLTLWELRGILYDMRKKHSKPFYYPVTDAIGNFFQRTISKILRAYEKNHPNFIKTRKWLYDYFYDKLDATEKKLDVCGWKEYNGECLRRDRICCKIPYTSPCFTETACNSKSLSCKFWLCTAALSHLASIKKGRSLLTKRRLYSYWCIAFNIPLRSRCSKINSFDDKAKEPLVDVSKSDWFDFSLVTDS